MAEEYEANPPRTVARRNISIYDFINEFGRIAPIVYALNNNNARLDVVPAYPDELVVPSTGTIHNPAGGFTDTITYQIIRREPASLKDKPFQSEKEIKPRVRDIRSTDDGAVEILGQWYDNLVLFDCWTTSNAEADDLLQWLEDFLFKFTGYFKSIGIQEMLYFRSGRFTWGTTEEEAMTRWRNPFKVRSLTYYVRSEKLWYINRYEIEEIIVTLSKDNYSA